MQDPCTVSVRMERKLRAQARFRAYLEGRTMMGYIRQLMKADIRAYEAEHGPIPIPDAETEKERTP